jgi:hypothetical protein
MHFMDRFLNTGDKAEVQIKLTMNVFQPLNFKERNKKTKEGHRIR